MKKKIVMILETDFRDEEAIYPFIRLQEAGFIVDIATDNKKQVFGKFGFPFKGTVSIKNLNARSYEGLVIPGGNEGPDKLRINKDVKKFIKKMHASGKLVAAICHGPWILISAGIIRGINSTCYKAIVDDLKNAGGIYHDEPVVMDNNIITSRHPRDLAIFMKKIIDFLKLNGNRHNITKE